MAGEFPVDKVTAPNEVIEDHSCREVITCTNGDGGALPLAKMFPDNMRSKILTLFLSTQISPSKKGTTLSQSVF